MFDFTRVTSTPEEVVERQLYIDIAKFYRLTPEEYQEQLAKQGGGCAICGKVDPEKRLAVDHNHDCCSSEKTACGKCVRGLLCSRCNHALGNFKDDVTLFMKAVEYLNFWKNNPRAERLPVDIPHGNKNRKATLEARQNMSMAHKTDGTLEFAAELGRKNVESGHLASLRTSEHQRETARKPRPKSVHNNQHRNKGIISPRCPFCQIS